MFPMKPKTNLHILAELLNTTSRAELLKDTINYYQFKSEFGKC